MKRNKTLLLFTVVLNLTILTFSGCRRPISANDSSKEYASYIDNTVTETETDYTETATAYIDCFEREHPDYLIADFVINDDNDSVIKSAIMAEDKETGYTSTVFIQTKEGVAIVTVNSGFQAYYRAADKMIIQGEQVVFSADCPSDNGTSEIHDYHLSIEITENSEGIKGIVVKNEETIR